MPEAGLVSVGKNESLLEPTSGLALAFNLNCESLIADAHRALNGTNYFFEVRELRESLFARLGPEEFERLLDRFAPEPHRTLVIVPGSIHNGTLATKSDGLGNRVSN
jgi:hypothetical protein